MMVETELPDDRSIGDEVLLWRRIPPLWYVSDGQGGRRLSSAAFQNYRDSDGRVHSAFSVCISCDAEEEGADPHGYIASHPGHGVAAFSAGLARSLEQRVARVPLEGELAHGHVIGNKPKSVQKALRRGATLLIEPE